MHLTFYAVMACGPGLFLAPLILLFKSHLYFTVGSSLLATMAVMSVFLWRWVFRQIVSFPAAAIGLVLVCSHPYLNEMHYYWKDELLYIVTLLVGICHLSRYLDQHETPYVFYSGIWFFFSYLMRSQALIAFPIGLVAIFATFLMGRLYRTKIRPCHSLILAIFLFIIPPLVLSLPFRWQNRYVYGHWYMNKVNGLCSGIIFNVVPAYAPQNGPHSKQLWIWGKDVLDHPDKFKKLMDSIPVNYQQLFSNGAKEVVEGDGHLWFMTPKVISYLYLRDMVKADDFAASIAQEAYRAKWSLLMTHFFKKGRYYFTGVGQNPAEWDPGFLGELLEAREHPLHLSLKDGSEVVFAPSGGLYFHYASLYALYRQGRLIFSIFMTYAKKLTFISLPFLFCLSYKRGGMVFWFLTLSVAIHLATGVALAIIITYYYHYSAPLEIFPILYFVLWIDFLCEPYLKTMPIEGRLIEKSTLHKLS
jgi:hypothetical protein